MHNRTLELDPKIGNGAKEKIPFYWEETLSRTSLIWGGWPADGEPGKGGGNWKIGRCEGWREEKNGRIRHPCTPVPKDKTVLVYIWLLPLDCTPPSPLCCPLPANLDSGWLRTAFAPAHAKAVPRSLGVVGFAAAFLMHQSNEKLLYETLLKINPNEVKWYWFNLPHLLRDELLIRRNVKQLTFSSLENTKTNETVELKGYLQT